jgi:hypothetical protein
VKRSASQTVWQKISSRDEPHRGSGWSRGLKSFDARQRWNRGALARHFRRDGAPSSHVRAGRDTLGVNATRSMIVTNRSHRDVKILPFVDLGPVAKLSENESQSFGRRGETAVELGLQAMDCPSPKHPETFPPVALAPDELATISVVSKETTLWSSTELGS